MVSEIGSVTSLPVTASRVGQVNSVYPGQAGAQVIPLQAARAGGADSLSVYAQVVAQRASEREGLVGAALEVRKASSTLQQADDLLAQIKENLTRIVKQYPPYGQDSPERLQYLNSISGLRKQLDALAFPPERKAQEEVPAALYPQKGDLAVPELNPETATDAEVASALDAVERAQSAVVDRREQMWRDVATFVSEPGVDQVERDLAALQRFIEGDQGEGFGLARRRGAVLGL